jgi:hypothetical protein
VTVDEGKKFGSLSGVLVLVLMYVLKLFCEEIFSKIHSFKKKNFIIQALAYVMCSTCLYLFSIFRYRYIYFKNINAVLYCNFIDLFGV